jgi:predicted lipoprotein with Yx(FWY)xxD motif
MLMLRSAFPRGLWHALVMCALALLAVTGPPSTRAASPAGLPSELNYPYPAQFDLVQEGETFVFRMGQNGLPLYVSSADRPGKSVCNDACTQQWPPVIADADAKPLGHWNLIVRQDGRRQWAFRNQPVYTHVSDGPAHPTGVSGSFHLLPPVR